MSFDSSTIDRIVSGVLTQLGGGAGVRAAEGSRVSSIQSPVQVAAVEVSQQAMVAARPGLAVTLLERVITADVLEGVGATVEVVEVPAKAIVTPAAMDVVKLRGLTIRRGGAKSSTAAVPQKTPDTQHSTLSSLVIIVHHTDAVAKVWDELRSNWRRELLGCPDDAAKLAISELSRGGVSQVVILADQTHRAACLANRHDQVKAVAIRDAGDIPAIKAQLRANVWCVSPQGKSWFELKRLFSSLDPRP